jgi:hypothetical protein
MSTSINEMVPVQISFFDAGALCSNHLKRKAQLQQDSAHNKYIIDKVSLACTTLDNSAHGQYSKFK